MLDSAAPLPPTHHGKQHNSTEKEAARCPADQAVFSPHQPRKVVQIVQHGLRVVLCRLGEPVGGLYFIASGTAKVEAEGAQLGRLGGGDFVGELTCLNGLPATATVTATSQMRVFFLTRDRLESVMNADAEINAHLLISLRNDVTRKLVRVNDRLTEVDAALKRSGESAAAKTLRRACTHRLFSEY